MEVLTVHDVNEKCDNYFSTITLAYHHFFRTREYTLIQKTSSRLHPGLKSASLMDLVGFKFLAIELFGI